MTKKTILRWRLRDSVTTEDVLDLLEKGIIDKDEARGMLFNEGDTSEERKALKEQVEFLREIVQMLLDRKDSQIIYRSIYDYTPTVTWSNYSDYGNATQLVGFTGASGSGDGDITFTTTTGSSHVYHLDGDTGGTTIS